MRLLLFLCLTVTLTARPNLLFITVDDMNRDSLGCYGSPIEGISPHIDRLAEQATVFDQGYVTIAICQPTRAVWMTGRYPHRNGALGFGPISKDVPCLPEALQAGGYHTTLLGKSTHVVPTRHAAFDIVRSQSEMGKGRDPKVYGAAVKEAIEAATETQKPFFIMANAHDPHRPFAGSKSDRAKKVAIPRSFTPDEIPVPGFLPDLPQIRQELATYYQSVHRADEVTGAILEALKDCGHEEDTLVIFMSDHGMPLPYAKTNCYLHSNATPWIVRWPGKVKAGIRDTKNFVSGIDLAPTLLDAAGLPPMADMDGQSILPLLAGEPQDGRNRVFTMINQTAGRKQYPMRAVNDGRFLYVWNGWADGKTVFKNESQTGLTFKAMLNAEDPVIQARARFFQYRCTEELYDLAKDPDCLNNLIGQPNDRWSPRASAMTKALWHWMKDTEDPQRSLFEKQVELALD